MDEDPGSCKRWISRKENTFSLTLTILILTCSKNHKLILLEKIHSSRDSVRKAREAHLIDTAMTLEPHGLNRRDELL